MVFCAPFGTRGPLWTESLAVKLPVRTYLKCEWAVNYTGCLPVCCYCGDSMKTKIKMSENVAGSRRTEDGPLRFRFPLARIKQRPPACTRSHCSPEFHRHLSIFLSQMIMAFVKSKSLYTRVYRDLLFRAIRLSTPSLQGVDLLFRAIRLSTPSLQGV